MIRNRVMLSLSLLFGAKVMNVSVPFLFKYAVDEVNQAAVASGSDVLLGMDTVPQALGTTAFSLLVGCKSSIILFYRLIDIFRFFFTIYNYNDPSKRFENEGIENESISHYFS